MPQSSPVLNLPPNIKQCGVEILVRGTVQGVGFRPFIYNLASRFQIDGSVTNSGDGVVIVAWAESERLNLFIQAISAEAPPLARISSVETKDCAGQNEDDSVPPSVLPGFTIIPSTPGSGATTAIPPDISLCQDCHRELLDATDRRYSYPFINCTNCGPRFTIVEEIPYDRPKTSMKLFPMCAACEKEYHDPANRRFHAQPNGCHHCGPQISLHNSDGRQLLQADPVEEAVQALAAGQVVAIRGLGGFHLAVDGCSELAVKTLRRRKNRPHKPLAIMVKDLGSARDFCHITPKESELLLSPEHPVVLLKKRAEITLAPNLAPAIDQLGVMLPYTPLHHLLFETGHCPRALVMTSGNISGSPICTDNDDALTRLAGIADKFILHNREILTRVDDSVVKIVADQQLILRRARGYVPAPIELHCQLPEILACGAGLKNTFCLGQADRLIPSQHIGELDNPRSFEFFQESVSHLKSLYKIKPEAVACDLHPDYPSTRYGAELQLPLYPVQHHHAHAVAVMAEHGLSDPVLAVVLDGTGLGEDGSLWGGEILRTDPTAFTRLAHLSHLHLPGGDRAATEPWRMGLSLLFSCYGEKGLEPALLPPALRAVTNEQLTVIRSMLTNGFNSPLTSSCGRLFDGIASLLGVRQRISYEGQAAMELEALARTGAGENWLKSISSAGRGTEASQLAGAHGIIEICCGDLITMVMEGIKAGANHPSIALAFHTMLIRSLSTTIEVLSEQTSIRQIVLSGGCMQNSLLLEGLFHSLLQLDLEVFTGNILPINDGGISAGQAIIGGLRHVSRNTDESNRRPG